MDGHDAVLYALGPRLVELTAVSDDSRAGLLLRMRKLVKKFCIGGSAEDGSRSTVGGAEGGARGSSFLDKAGNTNDVI